MRDRIAQDQVAKQPRWQSRVLLPTPRSVGDLFFLFCTLFALFDDLQLFPSLFGELSLNYLLLLYVMPR